MLRPYCATALPIALALARVKLGRGSAKQVPGNDDTLGAPSGTTPSPSGNDLGTVPPGAHALGTLAGGSGLRSVAWPPQLSRAPEDRPGVERRRSAGAGPHRGPEGVRRSRRDGG